MYPSRFRYEAPRSLAEAIGLLHEGDGEAKVLAGGQSLVPLMKLRFATPELLVDINNIGGLDYHREDADGTLRIGALCRHADLEHSALLPGKQPTMAAAAPLIADPIVRNRGTLVGSLCHADPQGDWASVGHRARRLDRGAGPGRQAEHPGGGLRHRPVRERAGPDEIAVEAVIPPHRGTRAGGYLKLERRVGDFATVGVAVAVETSGGIVTRAGIALTGVGGYHHRGHRGGSRRSPARRSRRRPSSRPPTWPRGSARPGPTTAAARSTSGTWCAPSWSASCPAPARPRGTGTAKRDPAQRRRRQPDMTIVYDDLGDEATTDVPMRRIRFTINGAKKIAEVEPRLLLVAPDPPGTGADRYAHGLRHDELRRLHRAGGRQGGEVLHDAGRPGGRARDRDRGGPGHRQRTAPAPGGLQGGARAAVRVLHPGDDDGRQGAPGRNPDPTEEDVRWALSGNLCRCTGYQNIVKSVLWAAAKLRPPAPAQPKSRHGRRPTETGVSSDTGAGRDQDRRARREPQARRGQPLHPRQGQLHRRHRAARHAAHGDPAQPAGARADQVDRHQPGLADPRGAPGAHRRDDGHPQPGLDAHAVLRHPGGAGHRQGAVPGPGGRLRHRRRPLHRQGRVRGDRRRVRAAAGDRQPGPGGGRGRAGHPRRQGEPGRQRHLPLGGG